MNTEILPLKNLRYRPLRHLLGRTVTIALIAETEATVLRETGPEFAESCQLQDPRTAALVLTKYGFLDLHFVVPSQLLTNKDRIRRVALEELGFVESTGDEADRTCLEALIEGIDQNTCWLRLFLCGEPVMDAMKRCMEAYSRAFLHPTPDDPFSGLAQVLSQMSDHIDERMPMTFTVEDACLTNSDAIWLAKHGYL